MGFMLPRVFACCMCLTLRIGCLVIGYSSLVFAALCLSFLSVSVYVIEEFVRTHDSTYNSTTSEHTPEELQQQALILYIMHGCFMAVYLYYVVISILLVVGVHREKASLLRWYVKLGLALLGLVAVMVIVGFVFVGFIASIPLLVWNVLIFYFLVVVRSAYLEMEDDEKPNPIEMNRLYIGQAYS